MKPKNEDGMHGSVVWVCERGHVDLLHKYEGNYTGRCYTCRDGSVCEPRFTPGRRSQAQKERDKEIGEAYPVFEEERRRRRQRREVAQPVSEDVKVTHADGSTETVPGDRFDPEEIPPPFELTQVQRHQILSSAAKMPDIVFPRQRPADVPADAPWPPAEPGDVIPVSANVFIVALGYGDRLDGELLHYEVRDRRDGRDATPIKATKPLDPKVAPTTVVEQFRPEREPGKVPYSEIKALMEDGTRAELERLQRVRSQHEAHLKELDDQPRNVRWPIKKTIEALSFRIGEIEKQLAAPKRKEQLEDRREREAEEAEIQEQQRRELERMQRLYAPGSTKEKEDAA